MAKSLELRLVHSGGNFTFSVEGEYLPRWEPVYKINANPPVVQEMRLVWEFRQCKLVASSVSSLWTGTGGINALATLLNTRGTGHPTSATLVGDPSGTPTTLVTLGPSDYEQFQVEALEGETDGATPRTSWRLSAAFTIRVSAVKKNADTNGIVGFTQSVSVSYPSGLQRVEWDTTITTKEGTSAVTKAQNYAALDVANYGSTYWYVTGAGGDGVDYVYEDADEVSSRTPTVCRALSVLQQSGVDLGTSSASGSLTDPVYSVTTRTTAKEVVTTYTAEARGANAESWVLSKKPGGSVSDSSILREPSSLLVRGTWEKRSQRSDPATGDTASTETRVVVSGGGRVYDFEPVAGDYEPVEYEGSMQPWQAVVTVTVERTGGSGKFSELRLPGPPGDPWRLIRGESEEFDPYRVEAEKGTDSAQDKWRREARLVFRAARPPEAPVSQAIASAAPVATHLYTGQVT